MRKPITITGCRSGADYLQMTLHQYFNQKTIEIFKYTEDLDHDFMTAEVKNIDLFTKQQVDIFATNYLLDTINTCKVIEQVKIASPQTKIIFISSTTAAVSQEILAAGADACFDCETIAYESGGAHCGGATLDVFAWIFNHFPHEPIKGSWRD